MKGKNLVLLNTLVIATLIVIRFIVFGWILLVFGLIVILPLTILHFVATNKGFKNYSRIIITDRLILWVSFFSFMIFILFQYEMDDRAGYIVIEAWIRKFWIGYDKYLYDFSNISVLISIITGLIIIGADIFILRRLKKINQTKSE